MSNMKRLFIVLAFFVFMFGCNDYENTDKKENITKKFKQGDVVCYKTSNEVKGIVVYVHNNYYTVRFMNFYEMQMQNVNEFELAPCE